MTNYLRQGGGGIVLVDITQLPDVAFIDAIKSREIAKASIISKNNYAKYNIKQGGPDVLLKSVTGDTKLISRNELCMNYTQIDGSSIALAFMHNDKDYLVRCNCSENYKIMKMPDNFQGNYQGKQIPKGSYIICKVNQQGQIDRNTMRIISSKLFRKTFKIPMQDIINVGKSRGKSKNFSLFNKKAMRNNSTPVNINIGNFGNLNTANTNNRVNNINKQSNIVPESNIGNKNRINNRNSFKPQINVKQPNNQNKYIYTVTHRVVDYNNKLVGFVVVDLRTNNKQKITQAQLAVACDKHLVNNVAIVKKESTGQKYLRGNGIELNKLPTVIN